MIKRAASYFFIIFGLVALWASTSRQAMQYITDKRDGKAWWQTYPCVNGDLVSMSYLDMVQKFSLNGQLYPLKRAADSSKKNTVLVLHGDSNSWHVADSNFAGVSVLYYLNRSNGGYYHIDTSRRNIMVIEVGERYLRSYFESLQIYDEIHDTGVIKKEAGVPATITSTVYASAFPTLKIGDFFNKYINQNLQCNLFNYNFMMGMFESKAALNYYLFNRASGDVVISDDRSRLFLRETVTKTDIGSSYAPVDPGEAKHIVEVLNNIYAHYKAEGFDEVYFSIIPNPASIAQPQDYNNLIPMVQNDPGLKMKIIDIYSVFKNSPDNYYLTGDTHWNTKGKQLWIDLVNKALTN